MSILQRFLDIERGFRPNDVLTGARELSADDDIGAIREAAAKNAAVQAERRRREFLAQQEADRQAAAQEAAAAAAAAAALAEAEAAAKAEADAAAEAARQAANEAERRRLAQEAARLEEERRRLADLANRQPPPLPGPQVVVPGDPVEEFDGLQFAKENYSWLGDELITTFIDEFNTNGGDEEEAIRVVRTTQAYKDKFPGIFREDGKTLRIDTSTPELDYVKIKEDYSNLLQDYNLNPEYFEDQIETLFKNDVSPFTFEERLNTAYNALFNQFDAVKQYYVNNYPDVFPSTEDITDEAIFASFISEDISEEIIQQRIDVAQIGGALQEQGFAISTEQATRLVSAGLTGEGAQRLAARAETQLPRLQRLARRFTGREDIFGLSEFIESEVFGSGVADQIRDRLEAEAQTAFTREGGAAVTARGVTGLEEV